MNSGSALRVCSLVLVVVLLAAEMTSAAPYADYDKRWLQQTYYDVHPYPGSVFFPDLRDLYELLLRNEAAGGAPISAYNHQMERKGGRSPSLRLRFGRRADPLWHSDAPVEAPSN